MHLGLKIPMFSSERVTDCFWLGGGIVWPQERTSTTTNINKNPAEPGSGEFFSLSTWRGQNLIFIVFESAIKYNFLKKKKVYAMLVPSGSYMSPSLESLHTHRSMTAILLPQQTLQAR